MGTGWPPTSTTKGRKKRVCFRKGFLVVPQCLRGVPRLEMVRAAEKGPPPPKPQSRRVKPRGVVQSLEASGTPRGCAVRVRLSPLKHESTGSCLVEWDAVRPN